MDQASRLAVFQAQTRNVIEIKKVHKQILRAINEALRRGDTTATQALTKTLSLVFCAWVEATFSKVIHTPYGFSLDEIQQIKKVHNEHGVEMGWEKCVELASQKASKRQRSNYLPNIRHKLKKLIKEYIVEPSLLRNKIAHGQWVVALNRENTSENKDLTIQLSSIDVVTISKWFKVYSYISQIVETMIESPDNAFHRDYLVILTDLEEYVKKTKKWTMDQKIRKLKPKPSVNLDKSPLD